MILFPIQTFISLSNKRVRAIISSVDKRDTSRP